MDSSPTAPILRTKNASSPTSPATLAMELPMPESVGRGDMVYPLPGLALVAGLGEPTRDPGPVAPPVGDGSETKDTRDRRVAAAEALVGMTLAGVERLVIEATVRACGSSLPKAARVLGVSPSTLYRKHAAWADRSGGRRQKPEST